MSTIHKVAIKTQKSQAVITVDDDDSGVDDIDDRGKKDDKTSLLGKGKKGNKRRSYHSTDDDDEEEKHLISDKKEYPNVSGGMRMGNVEHEEKERLLEDMWNELIMEQEIDDEEGEEDEEQYLHLTDTQLIVGALIQLFLGTFLCCIFSDPMVSVIGVFSDTIGVSSFFVSFIVTPIASNAAEIYSSILFAKKKTKEGVSMGFSALY
eukprot:UN03160